MICPKCNGDGFISCDVCIDDTTAAGCPKCLGTGIKEADCPKCAGTGEI